MRMSRWFIARLLSWCVLCAAGTPALAAPDVRTPFAITPAAAMPGAFTVLCYHEVRREVRDFADPFAVDSAALVAQFAWLRANSFVPVRLGDIIAARSGGKPLPAKAVLLSFDDAYLSFYTDVYPLLREFGFPAVLGVVGRWIDQPDDGSVQYGEKGTFTNARFPSWSQLREVAASGLVEIASHTYDLHRGVAANPQGNLQPAATTRIYDAATGRYEDDADWRARVRADLARSAALIERETGHRPRAIVWPYGSYNDELVRIAAELGMPVALTLNDGTNTPAVPLAAVRRTLIQHNPSLGEFTTEQRGPLYAVPVRVVQVNLDAVHHPDAVRQERNLSMLLERIAVLKPTHVVLQAISDGAGAQAGSYFPSRHLPLRADLLNRAAWQLASRAGVKVFVVLPLAGFRLTQEQVIDVYEDLARHANIDGLLFMQGRTPEPPDEADTARFLAATQAQADAAQRWRAPLKIARGLLIDSPGTQRMQAALAPQVAALAGRSDYVVIASYPVQGAAVDPAMLATRVSSVLSSGQQAVWSKLIYVLVNHVGTGRPTGTLMARQMREWQLGGAINFGYSGDDFLRDAPPLADIAPAMSLRIFPR